MSDCPVVHGSASSLADATLIDPKILARPNAFYDTLRAQDPVHVVVDRGLTDLPRLHRRGDRLRRVVLAVARLHVEAVVQ